MTRLVVALAAALVAVGAGLVAVSTAASGGGQPKVVVLTVNRSRFEPPVVRVRRGTTVRFVVHNTDPIDHELVVGPRAVQDQHEHGTEASHHGDVAGQMSLPAGTVAVTTYRFGSAGQVPFACHLPGHWAYGMSGVVTVS